MFHGKIIKSIQCYSYKQFEANTHANIWNAMHSFGLNNVCFLFCSCSVGAVVCLLFICSLEHFSSSSFGAKVGSFPHVMLFDCATGCLLIPHQFLETSICLLCHCFCFGFGWCWTFSATFISHFNAQFINKVFNKIAQIQFLMICLCKLCRWGVRFSSLFSHHFSAWTI